MNEDGKGIDSRFCFTFGAQVVLTGIQPAIAQTLIELDVDLWGLVTAGTLRSGIAYAYPVGQARGGQEPRHLRRE